jgi:3-isopropylmalate/(R)-2-methylmalate dehydratase small subunit
VITGRAWKYGKNVNTDVIIPGRYLNLTDPRALAQHAMEDLDPSFAMNVRHGDLIVADTNFGCGSSRESAPAALKAAGVSCIVARSFARIFFRNCINIGLPVLECDEAFAGVAPGDRVEVNLSAGAIRNCRTGLAFQAMPMAAFAHAIMAAGGLLPYAAHRFGKGGAL